MPRVAYWHWITSLRSSWLYNGRSTCGKSAGPGLNQASVALCPYFLYKGSAVCSAHRPWLENYRGSDTQWKIADMWCFSAVSLWIDVIALAWLQISSFLTSLDTSQRLFVLFCTKDYEVDIDGSHNFIFLTLDISYWLHFLIQADARNHSPVWHQRFKQLWPSN